MPLSLSAWTFFDLGHTDIRTDYDPQQDQWDIRIDRGEQGSGTRFFSGDEAALVANPPSKLIIPGSLPASFAFLGDEGDAVWILPQGSTAGVVFMGLNQFGVPAGTFDGGGEGLITLELVDFEGPGDFFLYSVQGGQATVHMDTRSGSPPFGARGMGAGGHAHFNWAFTQEGIYFLTFQPSGTRVGDGVLTTGDPVTFAFLIDPEPFDFWRFEHFGFQVHDPMAADEADPDADGAPNLLEYAMGGNPLYPDQKREPVVEPREFADELYLTLTYWQPPEREDIRYEIQASSDLLSWKTLDIEGMGLSSSGAGNADGDGVPLITVRDEEPLGNFTRRFMRLKVSHQ
ncbi:MAG: choice-of-anchor M domain-containing protein [Opitutales bacterium]